MFPDVVHLAITCNEHGRLAQLPGIQTLVLDPRTNDRSLAMTGSFSNLLLAGLAVAHGDVLTKRLQDIIATVNNVFPTLERAAQRLASQSPSRLMVLTSAGLAPLGKESCLKVLEMTAGRTTPMEETFLGVRHGPMSFLRSDSLVLCVLSSDADRCRFEEDVVRELRRKKLGYVIVVGGRPSEEGLGHEYIPAVASDLPDELRVPFEIMFAQLLAYHLSLKADLDPDNPSPDGVITRVVQQFQLY
jgi:tagatose-6-phosphate ketose/aldose isomerase